MERLPLVSNNVSSVIAVHQVLSQCTSSAPNAERKPGGAGFQRSRELTPLLNARRAAVAGNK